MFRIGRSVFTRRLLGQSSLRGFSCTAIIMSSGPSLPGPIHWVLDWDGTLTKRDTLDALVNIAAKRKPTKPIGEEWKRLSEAYMADYESTMNIHAPRGDLPSTVTGEKALLAILEGVEQRSVDRVSQSSIFEGLTATDLDNGAAEAIASGAVALREGCSDFLQLLTSRLQHRRPPSDSDAVSLLSVNWSRRFILACLRALDEEFSSMVSVSLFANELEGLNLAIPTTGHICVEPGIKLISSRNKFDQLEFLKRETQRKCAPILTVYIGDSWTDFECLLAADVGICMRDDPMTGTQKKLANSLERVGVSCPRLRDMDHYPGVAWVENFDEVREWMQGLE